VVREGRIHRDLLKSVFKNLKSNYNLVVKLVNEWLKFVFRELNFNYELKL